MRKVLVPVLSVLLGLGSAGIALAETCSEDQLIEQILIEYPALTIDEIESLVSLGYGFGEITIAAGLAEIAGITVSEVIAYAESGLSWGEIATLLEVDPGRFGQNVRQLFAQDGVKSGNCDLEREEALIREMVQARVRMETSLQQQSGPAANVDTEEPVSVKPAKDASSGQSAGKGSKGA